MDFLWDKEGTPMVMESTLVFGESIGKPSNYAEERDKFLSPIRVAQSNKTSYRDIEFLSWGDDNEFPLRASETISSTSVLNTGLRFLHRVTIGQGIYACRVTGYDQKGNEILEAVNDQKVTELIQSRMVRKYLEKCGRDYIKYGNALVEFIPNLAHNGIAGIHAVNAANFRYSAPDVMGGCKVCVSSSWPDVPGTDKGDKPAIFDVLQDFDPEMHFELITKLKRKFNKPVCMAIKDSWSNNDIYSEPIWLSAYLLGWVDIAHLVPEFLRKAYKNQITWKWHVQIPYSYWEKKFPPQNFESVEERKKAISKYMNSIERNLCGAENAEKPLFTNYAINEANGKIEEEWKIQALDNKYKGGENLVTSAAANSEILFALCLNPNVLGAMPSGNYGSNQGGSNIREAFLVNIANAWIDRQNLLDPIYIYMRANGVDKDVQLRFRNTVLTTLDSGAGTQKTLS